MNTTNISELYGNEIILDNASQEGAEWMRVLEAWCTELRSRDMNTINTNSIIHFLERFYKIHEKIHHRAVLIVACTIKNPNCIEEMAVINNLNNQFIQEQKSIKKILQSLRSKTFFGEMKVAYNIQNYMNYIYRIINDLELDWSVLPSGGLIYDPVDTLIDH